MKDLKHYFTENVKSCEASNGETKEVTKEPENGSKASAEQAAESPATATKRKRSRVKIKISQTNDVGPVCDIVESKNDLIDKTPSPFTGRGDDVKNNDEPTQNDTPKRSNSLPRKSGKNCLVRAATRRSSGQSASDERKNPGDENDNLVEKIEKKGNEAAASANGRAVLVENAATPAVESLATEREESNAFQVLMTRKKSLQFAAPAPLSAEQEELAAKVLEENKAKLKQNKEKLVALADKKGYSKRKLGEVEESEKIERRLEKRAKVFKAALTGKKELEEGSSPVAERRVMPGSLHNYFNKATPEQREKELTTVSTLVVKADVHIPECIISGEKITETAEMEFLSKVVKIAKAESSQAMAKINDIQVIESENLDTRNSKEETQYSQNRKKKPRWSLRINLQCNNVDGQADSDGSQTDDRTGSARRESKPRRSKVKSTNYEETEQGSESDASTTKAPKKRKSSTNLQKSKISLAKSSDSPAEILPIVVDIAEPDEPEVPEIAQPEVVVVAVAKPPTTSEKLAPLFMKRQKPDPATVEARRLFLHSVPAENEKPRTERKLPAVGAPLLPFPTVSHVTQLCDEAKIESSPFRCNFPMREKLAYAASYDLKDFKSVTSLTRELSKKSQLPVEIAKENIEEVLSEIEAHCADARDIWSRISTTAHGEPSERRKSPKRKGKKRKSSEKKAENIAPEENIAHDGIWTHKYRPTSTREIVGNEEAASKLRDWLDGWKAPLRKDESSGDEFYASDCSFAIDNNQVAVLLGPHGSGKTASVYAIAEELGYSVIEVNASSKRAGKKLLKELEEATKSHRIKKSEGLPFLPTLQAKKTMPKNSLILVEDVDLIFEEDEGFINATCQLSSNTKRPIVMTGRDTCSHLNRMAPQQLRIYYQTSLGSRVSALLELITLAESGCRLPRACLDRLLQNGDLRKALLQLQFLLLSGQPSASQVPTNFHRSLWQDMRHSLYKPAIKATKKPSKKKQQLANSEKKVVAPTSDVSVVRSLANDLERISFISTIIEVDDPALEVEPVKLEPGMSLDENTHAYSSTNCTSMEIAKWLRDRVMNFRGADEVGEIDSQNARQLELKKELNAGVNLALAQVSPFTLDGRLMTLDYLPSLRAICRSEELRVATNNKRGNRFYHYLKSLRLPSTSTRPNILAAACRMMRDKNSDS